MARHANTTAKLDEAERCWWSENADLEEQFCWVQEPRQQRWIRHRYLQTIRGALQPGATVLELGCGTGWLTLLLAEAGLSGVVGVDFSSDQIERARTNARRRHLEGRVEFRVVDPDQPDVDDTQRFDVVVMHAFLHHLSTAEVRGAITTAHRRLRPGGRLMLLEPTHFADGPTRGPNELRLLRRLESLPRVLAHRGLRRTGPGEAAVRSRLAGRATGVAPFGPAPKEIPFEAEELTELLEEGFAVDVRRPVLAMAHLVAQELLVSSLSQPRLWAALERPIMTLSCFLDRRFVRRPVLPSTVWVFELYLCTKRTS